jgi:hypothetical protein
MRSRFPPVPRASMSVTQMTPVYISAWGRVSSMRRAAFSSQVMPMSRPRAAGAEARRRS